MLGTPPAFILSQDQTLVKSVCIQFRIAWQFCSCLLFLGCWILHSTVLEKSLKEFSGLLSIVQLSRFICCLFRDSSFILSQATSLCQQLFYFFVFLFVVIAHTQVAVLTTNVIISWLSGIVNNVFVFYLFQTIHTILPFPGCQRLLSMPVESHGMYTGGFDCPRKVAYYVLRDNFSVPLCHFHLFCP